MWGSGDTTPYRMTGVTLHGVVSPVILRGVVSPEGSRETRERNCALSVKAGSKSFSSDISAIHADTLHPPKDDTHYPPKRHASWPER